MQVIPDFSHPFHFFRIERTQLQGLQGLFHLGLIFRPAEADIDSPIGKGKAITVAGRWGDLSWRHLIGVEEPPPACGRIGHYARSADLRPIRERFLLSPPVSRVVTDMEKVERNF